MDKEKWLDRVLVAGTLAFVALFVLSGGTAFAGIANTKHNLGSTNNVTGSNHVTAGTDEICVFCHTPHGADVSNPQSNPPLWNKRLATGATFQTYDQLGTSSLDGKVLAVGSVSIACLSCHDGTQAMDNIINAPGSGGFDPTGGGTNGLGYTWAGSRVTPEGLLSNDTTTGAVNVALIGTDLRNDHPIGIEYCGGGITGTGTTVSGTCRDVDFVTPQTASINSNQVFWVDTGSNSTRERTDMILYTRDFTAVGGSASTPSVECASCHDPHVEQGQAGPQGKTAGATFLRLANTGSAVCLACHVK